MLFLEFNIVEIGIQYCNLFLKLFVIQINELDCIRNVVMITERYFRLF